MFLIKKALTGKVKAFFLLLTGGLDFFCEIDDLDSFFPAVIDGIGCAAALAVVIADQSACMVGHETVPYMETFPGIILAHINDLIREACQFLMAQLPYTIPSFTVVTVRNSTGQTDMLVARMLFQPQDRFAADDIKSLRHTA